MDGLTDFLNARLDEDEAVAKAWDEDQRQWGYDDVLSEHAASAADTPVAVVDVIGSRRDEWWTRIHILDGDAGLAAHVARHDPARTLREVGAGRKRLALHAIETSREEQRPLAEDVENIARGKPFAYWVDVCSCVICGWFDIEQGACETLRIDAAVWNDNPGYRETWKP